MKTMLAILALGASAMTATAAMAESPSTAAAAEAIASRQFQAADTNHDGVLSAEEQATAMKERADAEGADLNYDTATKMLARADKNGDGMLSLKEYQKDAANRFYQLGAS